MIEESRSAEETFMNLAGIWGFLLAGILSAQTNTTMFEVASIRLHRGAVTVSADPAVRGSRVIGTASTLADMITAAYGVRYDQISDGPGWITNDRFHIEAKAPGDVPPTAEQARLMMQNLLAERFQLRLHRETRDLPVYELVVGKNGSKLKTSDPDAREGASVRSTTDGLHMENKKGSMERIARQLSSSAGRPIIVNTGLNG